MNKFLLPEVRLEVVKNNLASVLFTNDIYNYLSVNLWQVIDENKIKIVTSTYTSVTSGMIFHERRHA